ncbi:MAG: hypothetical protein OXI96_00805 [Acidimicrobiaceae bacterium]|nr:hypothetical protein [Acidimicrobiaceae bacterium]
MTTHTDEDLAVEETVEEIEAMSDEEFWAWTADLNPEEYSQEAWEECIAEGQRKAAIKNLNPPSHFYDTLDEMFADMEARTAKQSYLVENERLTE